MNRAISIQARIWMGIALFHLLLVTMGAASFYIDFPEKAGKVWDLYNRSSGSGFNYAFFAPGLFNQLMARFELIEGEGKTRIVPLTTGLSNDADLRMVTVVDQFSALDQQERTQKAIQAYRRSFTASLARIFFRRYPEAKQVVVHLEDYSPVSREDFLKGGQPEMTTVYKVRYSYRPKGSNP